MDASTATTIRSSRPSTPSRRRRTPPWRAAVQPISCSAENDRGKRLPAHPERLELFRRIARKCQTANPEGLRERTHTNHGKGLGKPSNSRAQPQRRKRPPAHLRWDRPIRDAPPRLARLKLLALVETRGSAVVLTPIGVRRVAKLPDRWEVDEPEWPTLRLAGGGGKEGEIDALDLLRCRREARA
jgi:hypothetical protein